MQYIESNIYLIFGYILYLYIEYDMLCLARQDIKIHMEGCFMTRRKFRGVSLFLAVLLCLALIMPVQAKAAEVVTNDIPVVINGQWLLAENQVRVYLNDASIVPMLNVLRNLGYEVRWDLASRTLFITSVTTTVVPTPLSETSFISLQSQTSTSVQTPIPAQTTGATPMPLFSIAPTQDIEHQILSIQQRVFTNSLGHVRWNSLIEIVNTGRQPLHLGLTRFDLQDASTGTLITTGTLSAFPNIIHPGERAMLWGDEALTGLSENTQVTFLPRWDIRLARNDRINMTVSDVSIREGAFGRRPVVVGRVTNNTSEVQSWTIVSALLYDEHGQPIGAWMTNIFEDIAPGATIGFEISGVMQRTLLDNITPEMVRSYAIYASPPQIQLN